MTASGVLSKIRFLRNQFESGEYPAEKVPFPFSSDDLKRLSRMKDDTLRDLIEDLDHAFRDYEEAESEVHFMLDVIEAVASGRLALAEIEKQAEAKKPPIAEPGDGRPLFVSPPPESVKEIQVERNLPAEG